MATIDMATRLATKGGGRVKKESINTPYNVEVVIDLAKAAETKGSALAAADVIEAVDVPDNTFVMASGIRVDTEMTGTSTDATVHVGTASDADQFVASFDLDAAVAGDIAGGAGGGLMVTADDTIDVTIATQTGTITGGKVTVWAVMVDVTNKSREPGLAAPGS